MSTDALEAISDVITTLQDEDAYNPVTVLGVVMSQEIITSIVSLFGMVGFACLNKMMNIDNAF